MGMFDEIKCEYPLPGNPSKDEIYQTKSMDCPYLDQYRINTDGTIDMERVERRYTYDETKTGFDAHDVQILSRQWVPLPDFRGEVRFYGKPGDFSAIFIDGKLVNVKKLDSTRHPNPHIEIGRAHV